MSGNISQYTNKYTVTNAGGNPNGYRKDPNRQNPYGYGGDKGPSNRQYPGRPAGVDPYGQRNRPPAPASMDNDYTKPGAEYLAYLPGAVGALARLDPKKSVGWSIAADAFLTNLFDTGFAGLLSDMSFWKSPMVAPAGYVGVPCGFGAGPWSDLGFSYGYGCGTNVVSPPYWIAAPAPPNPYNNFVAEWAMWPYGGTPFGIVWRAWNPPAGVTADPSQFKLGRTYAIPTDDPFADPLESPMREMARDVPGSAGVSYGLSVSDSASPMGAVAPFNAGGRLRAGSPPPPYKVPSTDYNFNPGGPPSKGPGYHGLHRPPPGDKESKGKLKVPHGVERALHAGWTLNMVANCAGVHTWAKRNRRLGKDGKVHYHKHAALTRPCAHLPPAEKALCIAQNASGLDPVGMMKCMASAMFHQKFARQLQSRASEYYHAQARHGYAPPVSGLTGVTRRGPAPPAATPVMR